MSAGPTFCLSRWARAGPGPYVPPTMPNSSGATAFATIDIGARFHRQQTSPLDLGLSADDEVVHPQERGRALDYGATRAGSRGVHAG